MFKVKRFGNVFEEGAKCPSCSSEFDKGGRLEVVKTKNKFLKCNLCKYSLVSEKTILWRHERYKKRKDKALGQRISGKP